MLLLEKFEISFVLQNAINYSAVVCLSQKKIIFATKYIFIKYAIH